MPRPELVEVSVASGVRAPRAAATAADGGTRASAQSVATVERAADVLLHFAASGRRTLGVTEIADDLDLSKAAVHRILAALRSRGLIEIDEQTRRYSLGPMSARLGLAYLDQLDVRRLARPELVALSRDTYETATLSVRTRDARMYVDQVTPDREVIMSVSLGASYPLHAGGSSKAFLAFLPDEEIDAYLARDLEALTGATVVDRAALRREIDEIRAHGYAQSFGERQVGAASVAAPVFDHRGAPAAVISVCGLSERFAVESESCARRLLETTGKLSRLLGYQESKGE
ncbi:MAG TPA: IclR family transcriptional regulator [Streptosporangiaceae bacterium]|nr:IclR family transcriptional regulator [Streptosporangiaceae bacterium]